MTADEIEQTSTYQEILRKVKSQFPRANNIFCINLAHGRYRVWQVQQASGQSSGYSEGTLSNNEVVSIGSSSDEQTINASDSSRPSTQEQATGSPPPERLPMDSQYDDSTGISSANWERAERQRDVPQTISKTDESRPSTQDLGRPFVAEDVLENLYGPAAANWIQEDRKDKSASQRQDEEIDNFQRAALARADFAKAEAAIQSTRDKDAAEEKKRADDFAAKEAERQAYVKKFFDPNASPYAFDETLNGIDPIGEEFGQDSSKPKSPKAKRQVAGDYTPQYYSGSQVQIYFNDVLIDEITNIQYTTITNKAPIYGYASELFDTVAAGNLLIQGSFTINFVEAGYLAIIAMAMLERQFGENAIGRMTDRRWVNAKPRLDHRVALGQPNDNISQFATPLMPNTEIEVSTRPTSILNPNSYLAKQALNQVSGLGNKEFRQISREAVFNKITKEGNYSGSSTIKTINGIRVPSRFDLIPPFDIYGIFGDHTNPKVDHTVRRLKDVYLTGQAQSVISNGEPVGESYTFIARDLE